MKNHLKRIASPRTWFIDRASNTFILRPNPSGHSFEMGLPLGIIQRDILKNALTMTEAKKVLLQHPVLVDGRKQQDHQYLVGLFDILTIPESNKSFTIILNSKSRVALKEISGSEAQQKLGKVMGKTALKGNKIQYNLHDGKNILSSDSKKKWRVGDTLVLSLPKLEVQEALELKQGATIYLTKGKHCGDIGQLKEINGQEVVYVKEGKEISTNKNYAFVVPKSFHLTDHQDKKNNKE